MYENIEMSGYASICNFLSFYYDYYNFFFTFPVLIFFIARFSFFFFVTVQIDKILNPMT